MTFWFNDPLVLLNKHKIFDIWPSSSQDLDDKLNSVTRPSFTFIILPSNNLKNENIVKVITENSLVVNSFFQKQNFEILAVLFFFKFILRATFFVFCGSVGYLFLSRGRAAAREASFAWGMVDR